jgi:hypothetical protein
MKYLQSKSGNLFYNGHICNADANLWIEKEGVPPVFNITFKIVRMYKGVSTSMLKIMDVKYSQEYIFTANAIEQLLNFIQAGKIHSSQNCFKARVTVIKQGRLLSLVFADRQ